MKKAGSLIIWLIGFCVWPMIAFLRIVFSPLCEKQEEFTKMFLFFALGAIIIVAEIAVCTFMAGILRSVLQIVLIAAYFVSGVLAGRAADQAEENLIVGG